MAPKTQFEAPDLANATPEMLIDEMGKLSVIESYVKKMRGYYKEAYYARTGINVEDMISGEVKQGSGDSIFNCETTRSDPSRIDQTYLKEQYPEIAVACTRSKSQLTTRFSLKEGATKPVVNDLLTLMKQELDLE